MRRTLQLLATATLAATLASCESKQDKAAEVKADNLEAQAAASPSKGRETQLNAQADKVEQRAGNADGGATTANTPSSSPSDKR
jgi:hypothetical protein